MVLINSRAPNGFCKTGDLTAVLKTGFIVYLIDKIEFYLFIASTMAAASFLIESSDNSITAGLLFMRSSSLKA